MLESDGQLIERGIGDATGCALPGYGLQSVNMRKITEAEMQRRSVIIIDNRDMFGKQFGRTMARVQIADTMLNHS